MRLRKRAEEVVEMIEKTEAEFAFKEESVEGDIHIGAELTAVWRFCYGLLRAVPLLS